jgi:LUD domain
MSEVEALDSRFANLAAPKAVDRTAQSLLAKGYKIEVVATGEQAKDKVMSILPLQAEVMTMTSQTLVATGLDREINESGMYRSVRKMLAETEDPKEKKALAYAPNWVVGSVHALTLDGTFYVASNTGSQLGAYAYGAGKVIFVISTAKIVADRDEAFDRIYHYSLPLESERARKAYGTEGSNVSKMLILDKEVAPDRIYVVLVQEKLGF